MATARSHPSPHSARRLSAREEAFDEVASGKSGHSGAGGAERARSETWRIVAIPLGIFIILVAIAVVGAGYVADYWTQRAIEARMGPKPNLVSLPPMSVRVPGGHDLDMSVKIELASDVDPLARIPNADRILDRLVDRLSDTPAEALQGTAGASRIRDAIGSAVREEYAPGEVKGILFERLLIH